MAIALGVHGAFRNGGGNSNGFTSSSLDTTGVSWIGVWLAEGLGTGGAITDSKSNTWSQLTLEGTSQTQGAWWGAAGPVIVGTGHTFTVSGTGTFPGFCVVTLTGTATSSAVDQQIGTTATFQNSLSPGSITPTTAGQMVLAGFATNDTTGISINGGFTILDTNPVSGFGTTGAVTAYLLQTSAAAAAPTFSETNNSGLATYMISVLAGAVPASTFAGRPPGSSRPFPFKPGGPAYR